MLFRNLFLYRFQPGVVPDADALEPQLAELALREPSPFELGSIGWMPPLGRNTTAYSHTVDRRHVLVMLGTSERILPPAVIAEELADRVAIIGEREGRRVGGKERKRIKEEIISEFLPRAFVRTRSVRAYVDTIGGWLVIDTASRKVAEDVVSLMRESIGRFPATPMAPEESPRALMTDWLFAGRLPDGLALDDSAELRDPAEAGSVVRLTRQDLESDEVSEHLKSGKQVFQLGVVYDGRLSLVLGEDLVVRKLRFLDVVLDQLDKDAMDSFEAEVDANFTLMTLELQRLLGWLSKTFGITELPVLRLDGGDAPRHMREAIRNTRTDQAAARLDQMAREDGVKVTLEDSVGAELLTFNGDAPDTDLYEAATRHILSTGRVSISGLQRHLRIGFSCATRLIERMEKEGLVSVPDASGRRETLDTAERRHFAALSGGAA